jgi:seryl-tRNA synthetase
MTSVGAATERDEFLAALVEAGHLVPSGVAGLLGRGEAFESVALAVDAVVLAEGRRDGAEVARFPPVLPRTHLEATGYLTNFPHLAGSIWGFDGTEMQARELGELAGAHQDWSGYQEMTDLVLVPAACYAVYPWIAGRGPLPETGRLVDVSGACFRREPSTDPARLQSFRMHENVRLGEADIVRDWHRGWLDRSTAVLHTLGLEPELVPANDPFFGRAGRMMANGQREQGLKLEVVCPISSSIPGAVASVNAHLDHFGQDFGITTASGDCAHSACVGFGLERIALALFRRHGLDPDTWPTEVLTVLWPEPVR